MPNLAAFLTYVILTTFTPGPNNILAISNASRYGFRRSATLLCGITCGFFLVMAASGLFSAFLSHLLPKIMPVMQWVGAAYILWLAWCIARSKPHSENSEAAKPVGFWAGCLLQCVNVKVILCGLTTFATFIAPYFKNPLEYLFFALFLSACGCASICTWALCGAMMQKFFSQYDRVINIVLALLLVWCAVTLL